MKKPGIPAAPKPGEDRARFDSSVKESLESIMGRRQNTLKELDPTTSTLANCISKINEIIGQLQ